MSLKRRRLRCEDYTVGWVCALPVELAAAKAILDEEDYCFPHDKENFLYTLGRVGDHNVVIACLPAGQMGTNSAATVAVQVKSKFTSIRFGLMVGVGGGVPGRIDIRLGDVVVSQPENNHGGVVQYDFGKATHGNGFRRIGLLNPPPTALLSAVAEVKANQILGRSSLMKFLEPLAGRPVFAAKNLGPDVLFRSTYAHVGGTTCDLCSTEKKIPRDPRPNHDVVVHYGTIASGNCVMKDGITRDRIDVELGGVLCYEMEAAGLMNSFPCLVIRGICDYADSHKNKRWQPYASATAAACAKEILSVIPAAVVAPMETVNDAVRLEERVRSAIATVDLHEFLSMLPVANQEEQVSPQQALDRGDPAFTWIFQNIDFEAWSNHDGPPVLWLSGAPEQNLPLVSSYVVNKKIFETSKTKGLVLYFFLSLDVRGKSLMTVFISTLLHQFLKSFSMEESVPLARLFLAVLGRRLIEWAARHPDTVSMGSHMILKHVLDLPVEDLQYALAVLLLNAPQGFSLIIDGLDRALHPQREFLGGVQNFIKLVSRGLEQDGSNFYVLLTSRPGVELNAILPLVRAIKYDKERQDCLLSLKFDNTRYEKISREHEGSFEWIWWHSEYRNWSTRDSSQVLYIQGKPGSGKSTLARYFHDNLLQREPAAASAVIAKFFYSHREGHHQTSHSSMLRSILYDVLSQDECFFYYQFQRNYREYQVLKTGKGANLMDWPYELLKHTLSSLQSYPHSSRYYFIIDAIDESNESDRRDMLNFLFDVWSNTKHCTIKALVASRPVGQLELRRNQFHGFIRLQDETTQDILNFARSFLKGLNLTVLLDKAVTYIINNAHGVFIWVQLVGAELVACTEEGSSEEEIFEFLESLPTELDAFYTLMLKKMRERRNLQQTLEIFQFVLFSRRPLTVTELLHALAIPKDPMVLFEPSLERLHRRMPSDQRLVHCGGNFLEIRPYQGSGTIQVIHQTVREFFLRPDGCVANSDWRMVDRVSNSTIAIAGIRYLLVLITEGPKEDPTHWSPTKMEGYVRHLDAMPFASYILSNLGYHLDSCLPNTEITSMASTFLDQLVATPSVHLLNTWVFNAFQDFSIPGSLHDIPRDFKDRALNVAASKGHLIAAEILLMLGAYADNELDPDRRTPLSWAAGNGQVAMVELVLSKGAVIDHVVLDKDARTPLSWAASNGHKAVVKLLLERGADPVAQDMYSGRTTLSWAVGSGEKEIVKILLLDEKVDLKLEKEYDRDRTLLSRAAEKGYKGIFKLLLDHGANIEAKDGSSDRTPLSWAAAKGNKAIIQLLLEKGAYLESVNKYGGRTPLLWAVEAGHKSAAKLLLDKGADIETRDTYSGRTPLAWAVADGHDRVVKLLLKRGADMESKDTIFGRPPLSWAAIEGSEGAIGLLLDHGANIESQDDRSGRTPLSWAVEKGHKPVVEMLLDRGADIEVRDNYDGRTPLSLAAQKGHAAIVELLLEKGADTDAEDNEDGGTPLWWATENGHLAVVRLLRGWTRSGSSRCTSEE